MAKVGAQRAAELTGVSKSTIQRAMKTGKLSYEVDNAGRRVIDVAELERAFGLVPQETGIRNSANVEAELEKATAMLEAERLKMRIRMLEDRVDELTAQIDDMRVQRDLWQKQAQQVLITSQYSQKQAEELQAELKERDRKMEMRRQQIISQQRRGQGHGQGQGPVRVAQAGVTGKDGADKDGVRKMGPIEQQRQNVAATVRGFDIQGLWKKVRGQDDKPAQELVVNDALEDAVETGDEAARKAS